MKIKLNIHDILLKELTTTRRIPNTLHLGDLLETPGAMVEIDLDQLLAENRIIAHTWTIADVHETRPDLNDDQAWEVLQACSRDLDSEQGISWETIEAAADKLCGAPVDRAERFGKVIADYTDYDAKTNLIDLLADALHWCRAQSVDFDDSLKMATEHFAAETQEGGRS